MRFQRIKLQFTPKLITVFTHELVHFVTCSVYSRDISSNSDLNFNLKSENKLSLKSDNSDFNLLCLPTDNFPTFADEFEGNELKLNSNKLLRVAMILLILFTVGWGLA